MTPAEAVAQMMYDDLYGASLLAGEVPVWRDLLPAERAPVVAAVEHLLLYGAIAIGPAALDHARTTTDFEMAEQTAVASAEEIARRAAQEGP